jgi:adenine specific DNA methylase Mod
MLKDIIEKNESVTINEKQIDILEKYFPSCFNNEGNFDIKKLEQVLNEKGVDITKEGYELNFLGKSYAKLLTALDTETIIRPDLGHNSEEENKKSENIYITGDNLDAVKHLLKSYAGGIKCIYIDPPYNTGSDGFVYMDNFKFTPEQLSEKVGIPEEEAQRILNMTSRGSASHSAWLTFMYPRLYIAKDLLSEDGVIFISIDDNEQVNLKMLCDEIFGERNHLGTIIWKNATDNNPTNIAVEHEYIVCYCINREKLSSEWKSATSEIKNQILKIEKELLNNFSDNIDYLQSKYTEWYRNNKQFLGPMDGYKFIDINGVYAGSRSVHNPGKSGYFYDVIHPITNKSCKQPLMGYRFPEPSMTKLINENRIIFGPDENKIIEIKVYAKEYVDKLSSVIDLDGRSGANVIRQLFENEKVFTNPKPVDLIKYLLSFIVEKDNLVLDFFSGSATTAHAVMQLNAEDDGNRKYIMVQIPEKCNEDGEAYKAGYRTINQIGIKRIEQAAEKIKNETKKGIEYGFKIYDLVSPKEKTLDKMLSFDPNKLAEDTSILTEFGTEAVLTTWKVQDGYGFNAKLEEINLSGYTVFKCDNTLYFIDPNITTQDIKILIEKYQNESGFFPNRIVLFGYSFNFTQLSQLKDNLKQVTDYRKIDVITRY